GVVRLLRRLRLLAMTDWLWQGCPEGAEPVLNVVKE
ncbi:MAG: hypothetical protein HW414_1711, partial [Dehalococcoidia bacterium]|nr:hypothetical protein [Dehalococcoidia bacterium]